MKISSDIAGLSVSHSHVTLVRLVERDGALHPQLVAEAGLPAGTLDERGLVSNPDALCAAVKHLCREAKPKVKKVYVALSGAGLSIQPVTAARQLVGTELEQAVQWEVVPGLPYDRADAVITHEVIRPAGEEDDSKQVLAVACHRDLPQTLISTIRKAGVAVEDVEPEPCVLPRALEVGRDPHQAEVLLDIGLHSSTAAIVRDGVVQYAETIAVGADHFTQALISLGMNPGEAEHFKRTSSLIGPREDPHADRREAMRSVADTLAENLYQLLSYDDDGSQAPKSRLVMTGGGAKLSGLAGHLNQSLGIEVELAEPAQGLQIEDLEHFPRQAAAFALALHPRDDKKKGKR